MRSLTQIAQSPEAGLGFERSTFRSNWYLEVLVFVEGGKPEKPEKNPRSKATTNNNLNPHQTLSTGIEPGSRRWEASAYPLSHRCCPSDSCQLTDDISRSSISFRLNSSSVVVSGVALKRLPSDVAAEHIRRTYETLHSFNPLSPSIK